MIHVYTGNGKGKTTAAMGLALRALGHGLRVCVVQYFKDKPFFGEQKVLKKFSKFRLFTFAERYPGFYKNISRRDTIKKCKESLSCIKKIIRRKKCDVLILDEMNSALCGKYICLKEFIKILKKCPKRMEIVITGRCAPRELIKIADCVSEIKEVKHYYNKGIKFRKGIEY